MRSSGLAFYQDLCWSSMDSQINQCAQQRKISQPREKRPNPTFYSSCCHLTIWMNSKASDPSDTFCICIALNWVPKTQIHMKYSRAATFSLPNKYSFLELLIHTEELVRSNIPAIYLSQSVPAFFSIIGHRCRWRRRTCRRSWAERGVGSCPGWGRRPTRTAAGRFNFKRWWFIIKILLL